MSDETTVTERLMALLDERGVGHGGDRSVVYFEDSRGYKAMAYEAPRRYGNGVLCVHHTATPEQAVEATLRRGTCKVVSKPCDMWECECGKAWWHGGAPNFCPHCGRRVIGADNE